MVLDIAWFKDGFEKCIDISKLMVNGYFYNIYVCLFGYNKIV